MLRCDKVVEYWVSIHIFWPHCGMHKVQFEDSSVHASKYVYFKKPFYVERNFKLSNPLIISLACLDYYTF